MRKGFTLIELLIVVIIIGILATISLPLYRKTIETSKATDALSILTMIAHANKMYYLDNNSYTTGQLSNTHPLVANRYVSDHPWSSYQWAFCSCDTINCGGGCGGCNGTNSIACAKNNSPLGAPYNTWMYSISPDGSCNASGTNVPPCPSQ